MRKVTRVNPLRHIDVQQSRKEEAQQQVGRHFIQQIDKSIPRPYALSFIARHVFSASSTLSEYLAIGCFVIDDAQGFFQAFVIVVNGLKIFVHIK